SVAGTPLTLNPEPDTFAWEIVTLDPPVLVNVSCRLELLPSITVPKLKLEGLAPSVPGVTPDPLNGTLRVGFEASLVMATFPLTDPLACGANCTLNVFDCPADKVVGKLKPLNVYPLPLALAWLIVTLVPPEFVRVAESVCVVPVWTFPKLRLAGVAASCPPVIPVPETGTVTVELVFVPDNPPPCPFPLCPCVETTKASEILPLSGPPAGGVKLTLTATLWPGAN